MPVFGQALAWPAAPPGGSRCRRVAGDPTITTSSGAMNASVWPGAGLAPSSQPAAHPRPHRRRRPRPAPPAPPVPEQPGGPHHCPAASRPLTPDPTGGAGPDRPHRPRRCPNNPAAPKTPRGDGNLERVTADGTIETSRQTQNPERGRKPNLTEPPRHVRRLQFLERMGSCQVVHRGGTRRSCVSRLAQVGPGPLGRPQPQGGSTDPLALAWTDFEVSGQTPGASRPRTPR